MTTMRVMALTFALTVVSTQPSAGGSWISGNTMKATCHSESLANQGICLGFATAIAGVLDDQSIQGWRACIPSGVTRGQLRDVMVKFLDDRPEALHFSAESLAAHAFEIAFPCPQ